MKKTLHLALLKIAFIMLFMCSASTLMAQIAVKGTVIDENGDPIIGASILEKGTTNGTITDFDGNFELSAHSSSSVLIISYIGYITQEVKVGNGNLNVTLQVDNKTLDEVIVVGYGVQRKSNVTGAISKVDEADMKNRTITSAQDALAGKTSGVQMVSSSGAAGEVASVRIRGYASNYSSEPLYIVDGVKVRNISDLDANDIESMEVLKDAASAAIYGAEAGNGVILVTTKRASEGKSRLTYDFQYSVLSLARTPELMNAKEYIQYYKEAGSLDDGLLANYDGKTDNNWFDNATENGNMLKHTLSFETANEKAQLYMSLNQMTNNNFLVGNIDKYSRYNFTLNGEMKLNKWLTVGTNYRMSYYDSKNRPAAFANTTSGYATGPFASMIMMDPLTPVYYDNNNLPSYFDTISAQAEALGLPLTKNKAGNYYGISQYVLSGNIINPLAYQDQTNYSQEGNNNQLNVYANISPFKGFVFTTRIGADLSSSYTNQYAKPYYAHIKSYNQYPTVTTTTNKRSYYQWENFANYNTTIKESHNLGAMIGMSYSRTRVSTSSASANNVQNTADNFGYLDYAASDATKTVGGNILETAKLSYFGRVNYNYEHRYMAEFTLRADAADLSVLSKQERWGYFPAVSLGWVASNEAFFKQNDTWTYAKLRASWGQNGSISNLSNFMYATAMTSNSYYSFDGTTKYATGAYPSSLGNYNLTWETSEQLDFGLDLRFFRDRLALTADYYIKTTRDLLVQGARASYSAGNTPSPVNAGTVENKGLDFDISWKDNIGKVRYGISANIATLKNNVTEITTGSRLQGLMCLGSSTYLTYFEEGYPMWYYRGYKVARIDSSDGAPVFYKLDGTETKTPGTDDAQYIGSGIPDFTYGITLTLGYKNFDFLMFGSGSQGGEIFNNMNVIDVARANKMKFNYTDRWTKAGDEAKYAKAGIEAWGAAATQYYMSDKYVFDGSYFKIKQIQLGYTFSKDLLKKIGLNSLRAYISLDDFFCFTSYPGTDPEVASRNSTNGIGVDNGSYPSSKKIVFGFNISL